MTAVSLWGVAVTVPAHAESGAELWLRYRAVEEPALRAQYREVAREVRIPAGIPATEPIKEELLRGLAAMLGETPRFVGSGDGPATLYVGLVDEPGLPVILTTAERTRLGKEGYLLRTSVTPTGLRCVLVANSGTGALYGTFRLLRLMQLRQPLERLDLVEAPAIRRRLLNHWDNLDGTIERGYAGRSIWRWDELPDKLDARYTDYARANASVGINGAVLNNVNAEARILTPEYLRKVAAIAGRLRPYGIRVYLSANFGAPLRAKPGAREKKGGQGIGNLDTADPLDPQVRQWWNDKVGEVYRLIPDFGGFLVKANSEGMPGPMDYDRSHVDGANMLAAALAPHDGVVMWRAFVYPKKADPDRAKRAHLEFAPFDGQFSSNVFVQVKNGPLDFQPSEPINPLFGAMPQTPLALELQITQEYLGESTHLAYLGTQWVGVLGAATRTDGDRATVASVVTGEADGHRDSAIAGVANVGSDVNWCGHDFAAANWYAFGRLAWDPRQSAEAVAREWIGQTWNRAPATTAALTGLLMNSWAAVVDYQSPLGLTFTMGSNHYDPGLARREGQYWRSDAEGLGYDRSSRGSDYVGQYHPTIRAKWDDPQTCPLDALLFYHRVSWDQKLPTGRSLWEELCWRYRGGAQTVEANLQLWRGLAGEIDAERHARVLAKLEAQLAHARRWRDESLAYFQSRSGRPLPQE
jgi:alpha-glucuronidase